MIIYHASVCHNFELRHQWQVSSILQQTGPGLPQIICDVAVLEGDRNRHRFPSTLPPLHNSCVELHYHPTPRETFARRGLVRDEQTQRALAAEADWIFYADCDRIYHPRFFDRLARGLEHPRLAGGDMCVTSPHRAETERDETDAFIGARTGEGPYHHNAFARVVHLAGEWQRKLSHAAGGMQIVRAVTMKEKMGGRYSHPRRHRDRDRFAEGQCARSDLHIREKLEQCRLDLPMSIHLNHLRDKEAGWHVEDQR